jgi:glycosyltransferase involved in cell wall biosynthesis
MKRCIKFLKDDKMDRLLSIVIPVYNVELYLVECIESIIRQYDSRIEIILVDDGSKDKSGEICDQYACREGVQVYHQKNMGLSGARNAGLSIANGKYIAFVDSDDRIAEGSLSTILSNLERKPVDMFFMKGIKFFPNGKTSTIDGEYDACRINGVDAEAVVHYIAQLSKYPGSACTKIYRKAFLDSNNINFPHDKRHSEDLGFVLDCLMSAMTFGVIQCDYYEYRQNREGSITSVYSEKSFWDLAVFVRESVDKLCYKNTPKDLKAEDTLSVVAYELSIMLLHFGSLKNEKINGIRFFEEYKWIFSYSKNKKIKVVGRLVSVFGVRATSLLLRAYYKNK